MRISDWSSDGCSSDRVSYEADRVGENVLAAVVECCAASGRVQGGEQRVLHEHTRSGERIEQTRLARVGVSDDGDRRDVAMQATCTLGVASGLHALDPAARVCHEPETRR